MTKPDIVVMDISITELIDKFPHHVIPGGDAITLDMHSLIMHILMLVHASGHTMEDLIEQIREVNKEYKMDMVLNKAN